MSSQYVRAARAALALLLLAAAIPAHADRVSLAGIDAKLDRLVGPFDPANHVTLIALFSSTSVCSQDRGYFRVNLDGTRDTTEFVVPANHTLFLTDISWQAFDTPTNLVAGRTLRLALTAADPNGANSQVVYFSPKVEITTANENGRLGANETLASGVAIGAGRIVCASLGNFSQSSFAANTVTDSVLRGFLVPTD